MIETQIHIRDYRTTESLLNRIAIALKRLFIVKTISSCPDDARYHCQQE